MGNFVFNPFTRNLDFVGQSNSPGGALKTLTGDTGGAISPDSSDNINILGGTGASVAGNAGTHTLTVNLNSYSNQTVTTTNATPNNSMTIPLGAVPGVYTFDINISAYDLTDAVGAGYSIFGTIRTDGSAGTLIGTPDEIVNEDTIMQATDLGLVVSGNNAVIQVTGILATTIHWRSITFYTFVS